MAYVMKDMELDDEDKADRAIPVASCDKPMMPQYPWGLRITLTNHELEKLGLDPSVAVVGGMVHGHIMARITSASMDQQAGGETNHRIELQIEQMCIESEDEENEEADAKETKKPLRSLYKG